MSPPSQRHSSSLQTTAPPVSSPPTAHRSTITAVFQHIPTGIRIHDIHAGNFIRQKNGILIPIDVFFEGLPASPG
jgi:hypothetical protein